MRYELSDCEWSVIKPMLPNKPRCIARVDDLYNQRPAWLDNAHTELNSAVASAYGWRSTISNDEALAHFFELNQKR